jgi:hypothetical protein
MNSGEETSFLGVILLEIESYKILPRSLKSHAVNARDARLVLEDYSRRYLSADKGFNFGMAQLSIAWINDTLEWYTLRGGADILPSFLTHMIAGLMLFTLKHDNHVWEDTWRLFERPHFILFLSQIFRFMGYVSFTLQDIKFLT